MSAGIVRAPGRVNLLGGHVDYHEGLIAAMAIEREVRVEWRARNDGRVLLHSADLPGTVQLPADGSFPPAEVAPSWGRLAGGVLAVLAERGRPPAGFDATVSTTLTIGGGLSSSAAFEVAIARVAMAAAHWDLPPFEIAMACREAEHRATGVPCGIQDQAASVGARAGHALVLDCRTLEVEHLPLPPGAAVVILDSCVPRLLEHTPWPARRAEGLALADELGVRALRDATHAQVQHSPRGRHVVSEIARVADYAAALRDGDAHAMGELMRASHRSLRDDMEVSIPELDFLVEQCVEHGAFGARLTGGGFGGCVVALVPEANADAIGGAVAEAYQQRHGRRAEVVVTRAAAGAGAPG